MRTRFKLGAVAGTAIAALAVAVAAATVSARSSHANTYRDGTVSHVLLISVDGMHQSDVAWFVKHHPRSVLAQLTYHGLEYVDARTPIPSDSFPGMVAQVTGGDPRVAGVYYDAEYNHDLLAPGTVVCRPGMPLGAPAHYDETIERNSNSIDAGQGLSGLPGSILQMTGQPQTLIDPSKLPVDPNTCEPVYPHQYLKVNTIFNVVRAAGLRTAWSDKHPAYEILNGPSGDGIQDLFTPEINSEALEPNGKPYPGGGDWTSDNAATIQYDSYKVRAVINEIDGYDHSRTHKVGVPAIFGMNFQTVSTAQKLLTSDRLAGGYLAGTDTPGPLLARALDYINAEVGAMVSELRSQGLSDSTAIIISAKHGQSPIDPNDLTRIDGTPIINGINAAWQAAHPGAGDLIADATDDDAIMMWLTDRSDAAGAFVSQYLWNHPATGTTISGGTRTLLHSGLVRVFTGAAAARYFGVPRFDPRHPEVWGVVQEGVVYTGGTKIAEHGGSLVENRDVPILLDAPGLSRGTIHQRVYTKQIAPTILRLLGLNPFALDAVRIEGTRALPGT
jgi:hypothetical protein